jgi:small redox-active disulfide protein 2
MNIQVLGSGCPTCQKLHKMVEEIVDEAGKGDGLEYLTGDKGTGKILELGLMSSPVLTVDGKVVMVGFIPDKNKVKEKIYGYI